MVPTPVCRAGESHGERSLAGYSPRGLRVRHDRGTHTHIYTKHPELNVAHCQQLCKLRQRCSAGAQMSRGVFPSGAPVRRAGGPPRVHCPAPRASRPGRASAALRRASGCSTAPPGVLPGRAPLPTPGRSTPHDEASGHTWASSAPKPRAQTRVRATEPPAMRRRLSFPLSGRKKRRGGCISPRGVPPSGLSVSLSHN